MSESLIHLGRRYDAEDAERVARMWCPGCRRIHQVLLDGPGAWGWNGSTEAPTFTPSILVQGGVRVKGGTPESRCHSFVTDGVWKYLGDCTHPMAGREVPMTPIPDEVRSGTWWSSDPA